MQAPLGDRAGSGRIHARQASTGLVSVGSTFHSPFGIPISQ